MHLNYHRKLGTKETELLYKGRILLRDEILASGVGAKATKSSKHPYVGVDWGTLRGEVSKSILMEACKRTQMCPE